MSTHNYLCVFIADPNITDDVVDVGQDPDFSHPCPTWGICRPPVRSKWVGVGDYVVFVGHYRNKGPDLVKGWFRVGQKITYLEALDRFPSRRNVIIRYGNEPNTRNRWKRTSVEREVKEKYDSVPRFLTTINLGDKVLIQNPEDDHQIDNWKCQRMFLCRYEKLKQCIREGSCLRENEFPTLKGYLVADEWCDVGQMRIPWENVVPSRMRDKKLTTPKGQHNALSVDTESLEEIRTTLFNLCSRDRRSKEGSI